MVRIFTVLAVLASVLLVTTFWLGVRVGEYNEMFLKFRQQQEELVARGVTLDTSSHELPPELQKMVEESLPMRQRAAWHKNFALLTSLVVLLVNSVSITYFIGTSRWCKEVTLTYQLNAFRHLASLQLKRQTFAWALAAILAVMLTVGFGAASDPGIHGQAPNLQTVNYHYVAAMISCGLMIWAFMVQAFNIQRNTKIVEEIMAEVQAIRAARGLPVNPS